MESGDQSRVERERDLYQRCLELSASAEPGPLLGDVLRRLATVVAARTAQLELTDRSAPEERTWSHAIADDGPHTDVRWISRGVISVAMETGQTVLTDSAAHDERFADRESVVGNKIESVVCVPIVDADVVGALYLQDRRGGGAFSAEDARCAETVTRHLESLAPRLLAQTRGSRRDQTARVRQRIEAPEIIGASKALADVLERIVVVAAMESNVLLTGASGTGKTMFARLLHAQSRRKNAPFVVLSCAALAPERADAVLFGSEGGNESGCVARAEGGTLFLDEMGGLEGSVQARLLQLLQSREYVVPGQAAPRRADVRIVAATHADLETASETGGFRSDLYYRIRGVEVRVPSLAERRADIPLLAHHLCSLVCAEESLPEMMLSRAALTALEAADWPGNVRQLRNVCRDAAVTAHVQGTTTIELRHVFPGRASETPVSAVETFQAAKARLERAFLASALAKRDWNVALTSRELEMSRSHLNSLIARYRLSRPP